MHTDVSYPKDDGSMTKIKRDTALETIRTRSATKVILASLKAAGTGESDGAECLLKIDPFLQD